MALTPEMQKMRRAWRMRAQQQQAMSAGSGGIINLSSSTIAEDAASGTTVGTLSVAGARGTASFTLVDDAGGTFSLTGSALKTAATLDYETTRSYSITVSVSGVTPTVANRRFVITVTDVFEAGATNYTATRISQRTF